MPHRTADPALRTTAQRLDEGDLAAACALLSACHLAINGFEDFTRDEVRTYLRRPDLECHGWYDEAGSLAALAWVHRQEGSNQVELDVYVRPDVDEAAGHRVLAFAESRGREMAEEAGYAEPWLGTGVYRRDSRTRGWLEAAGYDRRTTFTRMRIDLDRGDAAEPADPARDPAVGPTVRQVHDEADLRIAHRIDEDSFVEHFGHVERSYQEWHRRLAERGPDFVHVYLADLEGAPVGVMVTSRQFEEDEDAGYVRTLGVLAESRGRGAGTALLRDYFARAGREGRRAVLLHVDVANTTGALRLYESVGMRPVLEIDAWGKGRRAER